MVLMESKMQNVGIRSFVLYFLFLFLTKNEQNRHK